MFNEVEEAEAQFEEDPVSDTEDSTQLENIVNNLLDYSDTPQSQVQQAKKESAKKQQEEEKKADGAVEE